MSSQINSSPYSLPPAVQRVANAFRVTGWVSFWGQLVLSIISGVVLLFAGSTLTLATSTPTVAGGVQSGSAETGTGLFLSVCGLLVLLAGAFWAFRYTRMARRLKTADAQVRPKRSDVFQLLRLGLLINLSGMAFTILGAQAIVGALVAKSFAQGFSLLSGNPLKFVNPLDVFLVQASTNITMAHFIGLLATLWLLRCMNRQ